MKINLRPLSIAFGRPKYGEAKDITVEDQGEKNLFKRQMQGKRVSNAWQGIAVPKITSSKQITGRF